MREREKHHNPNLSPEHSAALRARLQLPQEIQDELNLHPDLFSDQIKIWVSIFRTPNDAIVAMDAHFAMLARDYPDYLAALRLLYEETQRILDAESTSP